MTTDNDNSPLWRILARIGIVIGIMAAAITVIGALRGWAPETTPPPSAVVTQSAQGASQPTATATSLVLPSPTATVPPPKPGQILCHSGANDSWSGWPIGGPWNVVNGVLLNSGQDFSGPGFGSDPMSLVAPDRCQPPTPNYAVEARIKAPKCPDNVGNGSCFSFGITARFVVTGDGSQGYTAVIHYFGFDIDTSSGSPLVSFTRQLDGGYHTYRLQVKDTTITLYVDGARLLTTTDTQFLAVGQVGLYSGGSQLQVSDFRLIAE